MRAPLMALVAAALVAAGAAACRRDEAGAGGQGAGPGKKAEPGGHPGHKRMEQAEYDRGWQICEQYVKRLCGCAEKDPSLRNACELAQAQPEALEKVGRILDGSQGKPSVRERELAEAEARKVIAACLRADGQLDPGTCPRLPPP